MLISIVLYMFNVGCAAARLTNAELPSSASYAVLCTVLVCNQIKKRVKSNFININLNTWKENNFT